MPITNQRKVNAENATIEQWDYFWRWLHDPVGDSEASKFTKERLAARARDMEDRGYSIDGLTVEDEIEKHIVSMVERDPNVIQFTADAAYINTSTGNDTVEVFFKETYERKLKDAVYGLMLLTTDKITPPAIKAHYTEESLDIKVLSDKGVINTPLGEPGLVNHENLGWRLSEELEAQCSPDLTPLLNMYLREINTNFEICASFNGAENTAKNPELEISDFGQ